MATTIEQRHYLSACSLDREDPAHICACGEDMRFEECGHCEDGYTRIGELHEMDPLWYDEDDVEPCDVCRGEGGWWICWSIRSEEVA